MKKKTIILVILIPVILLLGILMISKYGLTTKTENVYEMNSTKTENVYEMNSTEILTWIKSKNIEVPEHMNNDQLGTFVVKIVKSYKENGHTGKAFNYDETNKFVDSIESKLENIDKK